MKIVCSWCRREGKFEFVGEKAPLDDVRETHGICRLHRNEVQARWYASFLMARSAGAGRHGSESVTLFRWAELLNLTKNMRS